MKVAIAFIDGGSYCEDVGQIMLHRHVTEWKEITEEEHKFLKKGVELHNSKNYNGTQMYLITLPSEVSSVVFDTIEEGRKYFERIQEERRKYEESLRIKREEAKARRDAVKKKKPSTIEDKKKLLELLRKEIQAEEKKKAKCENQINANTR